jgi:hypothetical protein
VNVLSQLNSLLSDIKKSTEARRNTDNFSSEEECAFSTLVYLMEECAKRRTEAPLEVTRTHLLVELLYFVREYHQEWIAKPAGLQEVYV